MRYVLPILGPSGSGKTTLAQFIATNDSRFRVFGTGDVVRSLPDVGLDARGLDPREDVVRRAVRDRLREPNYDVLLLDGFPRSLDQLVWLQRQAESESWLLLGFLRIVNACSARNRRARGRDLPHDADMAQRMELLSMRSQLATCPVCVLESKNTDLHELTKGVMPWIDQHRASSSRSNPKRSNTAASSRGTQQTLGLISP